MKSPGVEAILDVLVAGPDFPGLRRALFVTVACRHMDIRASNTEAFSDASEGRMPLDVLLARLPTRTLASIAEISRGRTGIKDAKPGPYPLVVTAAERSSSDHFDFEGPGVMIPMVSSTGHGDASLKRVHFQDGKYAVGSILSVVQPRDPEQLSARYLHAYLSGFKDELLVSRMVGTANVSLTVAKIGEVPVPLLPIDAQLKVAELMALCDRLEAEQADAEVAHAKLVEALLASLTQARDAADFRASWQQLAEHFHTLFTTEASVDALKQTVLQLGVMGKLVVQNKMEEPASKLLERLARDRRESAAELGFVDTKLSSPTQSESFQLPSGWAWTTLASLFRVITDGDHQAPPRTEHGVAFLTIGNITAGELKFDGCRQVEPTYFESLPTYRKPARGDLLYTVVGATYGRPVLVDSDRAFCVQRHIAILKRSEHLSDRFALYLLKSPLVYKQASNCVTGTAQPTIPLKPLRSFNVPLPPLAEQHRIVAKVDELLGLCDQLKQNLATARQSHERLASVLVEQAVA